MFYNSRCTCKVPAEGWAVWGWSREGQGAVRRLQSSRRHLLQVWRDGSLGTRLSRKRWEAAQVTWLCSHEFVVMLLIIWVCVSAPVVSSAEQQETQVEEEEFELPTLEEVARATGTLRSEPIGGSACSITAISHVSQNTLATQLFLFIIWICFYFIFLFSF